MGDNRIKCRKPLYIDQSLNCLLPSSIHKMLFVHCLCILLNYRPFGLVAILEYAPFCIGRHIRMSALLDQISYWIFNDITIKYSV